MQDTWVNLPTGDVTFLFSDIEGSTRLAQQLGAPAWAGILGEHDRAADLAVGWAADPWSSTRAMGSSPCLPNQPGR